MARHWECSRGPERNEIFGWMVGYQTMTIVAQKNFTNERPTVAQYRLMY
jgi:hypothetical protein